MSDDLHDMPYKKSHITKENAPSFNMDAFLKQKNEIKPLDINITKLLYPDGMPEIFIIRESNISSLKIANIEPVQFNNTLKLDFLKFKHLPEFDLRIVDTITPEYIEGMISGKRSFDVQTPIDHKFLDLKYDEFNVNPDFIKHSAIPEEFSQYAHHSECEYMGNVFVCGW
jgi:hypothetical protein